MAVGLEDPALERRYFSKLKLGIHGPLLLLVLSIIAKTKNTKKRILSDFVWWKMNWSKWLFRYEN